MRAGTKKPARRPATKVKSQVDPLGTWVDLNAHLMKCRDVGELQKLLDRELSSAKRPTFAERIHSRINKLRADEERLRIRGRLS